MSLSPGTRIGAFEILASLGAGGMGEVYKARDARLNRTVAIKILPQDVASDPTLKQRFEREAKALAALSHPHICTVYDVGQAQTEHGAIDFIVMEHLDGDTLAVRLARGPLPISDALTYAVQIADALDKAHRTGVMHRDLKPGNIMLTADGAKLLDFGLAKMTPVSYGDGDMSAAPTVTSPLTFTGTIVGTFQYMAPEQLEGHETDSRSDIFAFGAVLYEMLTGRRAFEGKSQASLIAAILEREPASVSTLQPTSPAAIDQIVKTCLAKNPDNRWQSAGDIGRQLKWIVGGGSRSEVAQPAAAAAAMRRKPAWLVPAATAIVAALVVGLSVWALKPTATSSSRPVSRLLLTPSPTAPLVSGAGTDVTISPDGTRIVYLGDAPQGGRALYVRELGGLEPVAIAGTEVPSDFTNANPSFSWDGLSIVFRAARKGILKVPLGGGVPIRVADDEPGFLGAALGPGDEIIFALVKLDGGNGLYRVLANGGALERLTPAVAPNVLYTAPTFLPDGKTVLYYLVGVGDQSERVAAFDLTTREQRILIEGGANPMYSPSGHLVFARGTTLMAVPFDVNRMAVSGNPIPVVTEVRHPGLITAADYSLARDGTLIYVPADVGAGGGLARVVWVDRAGRLLGSAVDTPLKDPRDLQVSPDGHRLLITTGLADISVYDLSGRPAMPLVSGSTGSSGAPIWSPDGKQVFFTGRRDGLAGLYSISADGSALTPKQVPISNFESLGDYFPGSSPMPPLTWLRDGRLVIAANRSTGGADIMTLPAEGGRAEELIRTDYVEDSASVSPDGKWLAYRSNRTGRDEIWVQAAGGSAPVRVSQNGGREPLWSRSGRELFYLEGPKMMALVIKAGQDFAFDPPTMLFDGGFLHSSRVLQSRPFGRLTLDSADLSSRTFDVVADGRFLMFSAVEESAAPKASAPPGIMVVQNWSEELKRLVPTH